MAFPSVADFASSGRLYLIRWLVRGDGSSASDFQYALFLPTTSWSDLTTIASALYNSGVWVQIWVTNPHTLLQDWYRVGATLKD